MPTIVFDSDKDMASLIDIIVTSSKETIKTAFVIPMGLSDHDMVGCIRKKNFVKYIPTYVKCRTYRDYDPTIIATEISNTGWSPLFTSTNVNQAVEFFNTILTKIIDRNIPIIQKRIKCRACPWIDEVTRDLMDKQENLLRKATRTNTDVDKRNFKRLRNLCNNFLRNAR